MTLSDRSNVPAGTPGEQGARVWTIFECPNGKCDPWLAATPCSCVESVRNGVVRRATRVPAEVVPRLVSPEAEARVMEAVAKQLTNPNRTMLRLIARAVLSAAGLLVGSETKEGNE